MNSELLQILLQLRRVIAHPLIVNYSQQLDGSDLSKGAGKLTTALQNLYKRRW
jgi:hypothetical protein